jgi:uncharacterized membrane protein (DUF373 family)
MPATASPSGKPIRDRIAGVFRFAEQGLYVTIGAALGVGAVALLVDVAMRSVREFSGDPRDSIIRLLEGLLLVFILAELIHTVRAVIEENVLRTEPFLIVGIVAAIRRLLVATAEADRHLGADTFRWLVVEMGVLAGTVALIGLTIYLVRHTVHSEPLPAHERDD